MGENSPLHALQLEHVLPERRLRLLLSGGGLGRHLPPGEPPPGRHWRRQLLEPTAPQLHVLAAGALLLLILPLRLLLLQALQRERARAGADPERRGGDLHDGDLAGYLGLAHVLAHGPAGLGKLGFRGGAPRVRRAIWCGGAAEAKAGGD